MVDPQKHSDHPRSSIVSYDVLVSVADFWSIADRRTGADLQARKTRSDSSFHYIDRAGRGAARSAPVASIFHPMTSGPVRLERFFSRAVDEVAEALPRNAFLL